MKATILLASLLFTGLLSGQNTFQKAIGSKNNNENTLSSCYTYNKHIVMTGFTNTYGAGTNDCYVICINENGDTLWTKTYGAIANDETNSIHETSDHGFIIAGKTFSFSTGMSSDGMVLKLDSLGNLKWSKAFGGSDFDEAAAAIQTKDGNYLVLGFISNTPVGTDILLLKLDTNGDTLWTKIISGTGYDDMSDLVELNNGDIIICGYTDSFTIDYHSDLLLMRMDKNGNIKWSKTYGGSLDEKGGTIHLNSDSTLLMCGWTSSFGAGSMDAFLLKTDLSGNTIWSMTYGGPAPELLMSVKDLPSGQLLAIGATYSYGAGDLDSYLLKLNSNGDTLWARTYGGKKQEMPFSFFKTSDKGYVITGGTASFKDTVGDIYIIKTDSLGNTSCKQSSCPIVTGKPICGAVSVTYNTIYSGCTFQTANLNVSSGAVIYDPCIVSGISDPFIATTMLDIFPNPLTSSSSIELSGGTSIKELSVFNSLGQKATAVSEINSTSFTLERGNLAPGIYLLSVTDNRQNIISRKIIIE